MLICRKAVWKSSMTNRKTPFLPHTRLDEKNRHLREENIRLRKLLASHGIHIPPLQTESIPHPQQGEQFPLESKDERAAKRIALFRDLFRGRQDVYSRRWENSNGRSGYAPAALKDWKAINTSRPEDRKRVEKQTRTFLSLTDTVIESHLLGKETIGIYPLLPDETCWFLAVDFDKKSWQDDAHAFLETCEELNIPAVLERSRSGTGGHIWIFFDHAYHGTPASTRTRFL
jgi:hypothetical protein